MKSKSLAARQDSFLLEKIQKAVEEKDLPAWRPRLELNSYFRFCEVCKRWNCLPIRFVKKL
jgi:hypothetical protein